jgi:DNA invertase Pin-like site-specific DNA recombinase
MEITAKKVVAYVRKSQEQKGQKYSLEAQEAELRAFASSNEMEIAWVFADVSSGMNDNRSGLKLAVEMAEDLGCPLMVLRIDRLSRRPSKIFTLLENPRLQIVVAELGLQADPFLLGQMALFSNLELELNRRRTKEGLKKAKERGVQLGNPRWEESVDARAKARIQASDDYALSIAPIVEPLYKQLRSYGAVARTLNEQGIRGRRGGKFSPQSISNVIKRLKKLKFIMEAQNGLSNPSFSR